MARGKTVIVILMILIFLAGLVCAMYPRIQGAAVDTHMQQQAQVFIDRVTVQPSTGPTEPYELTTQPVAVPYADLFEAMQAYNQRIWEEKQEGLCNPWSYQQPSFTLGDYGLEDEVFGVISIPSLELELPLYLGATYQHMADGAAHLSQTSLPIGGNNTNCVIAGHRGWGGAAYFRYITDLLPGDEVIITNLWGDMTYTVTDTQIIAPNDVDQILIQEGRDMITLLTCHPYASGGKQRYLVFCERYS
jgi:sortase A